MKGVRIMSYAINPSHVVGSLHLVIYKIQLVYVHPAKLRYEYNNKARYEMQWLWKSRCLYLENTFMWTWSQGSKGPSHTGL